MARVI